MYVYNYVYDDLSVRCAVHYCENMLADSLET